MSISIFGIRHHGPGCARSLCDALEKLELDIVLVEGPSDAQHVLPLLAHEGMRPPVALLIYAPDTPQQAVYYPFTSFSPEWQALHYALQHGIPARFMDLPQAFQLGIEPELPKPEDDPLGMLAQAAGYTDHELWWEQQIEQRRDITNLFEGILEAVCKGFRSYFELTA